jgi:hypothetical protein
MLSGLETTYEKALDYSSKKYGNGLEKISIQDPALPGRQHIHPRPFSLFPLWPWMGIAVGPYRGILHLSVNILEIQPPFAFRVGPSVAH